MYKYVNNYQGKRPTTELIDLGFAEHMARFASGHYMNGFRCYAGIWVPTHRTLTSQLACPSSSVLGFLFTILCLLPLSFRVPAPVLLIVGWCSVCTRAHTLTHTRWNDMKKVFRGIDLKRLLTYPPTVGRYRFVANVQLKLSGSQETKVHCSVW